MDANVVFRAYQVARDAMEYDVDCRASTNYLVPVTAGTAHFGIAVDHDFFARRWQRHNRQMKAFETRMRHIVAAVDGIMYSENIGKARISKIDPVYLK